MGVLEEITFALDQVEPFALYGPFFCKFHWATAVCSNRVLELSFQPFEPDTGDIDYSLFIRHEIQDERYDIAKSCFNSKMQEMAKAYPILNAFLPDSSFKGYTSAIGIQTMSLMMYRIRKDYDSNFLNSCETEAYSTIRRIVRNTAIRDEHHHKDLTYITHPISSSLRQLAIKYFQEPNSFKTKQTTTTSPIGFEIDETLKNQFLGCIRSRKHFGSIRRVMERPKICDIFSDICEKLLPCGDYYIGIFEDNEYGLHDKDDHFSLYSDDWYRFDTVESTSYFGYYGFFRYSFSIGIFRKPEYQSK